MQVSQLSKELATLSNRVVRDKVARDARSARMGGLESFA